MSYPQFNLQPNFKPVDHIFELRLRQFTDTGGQYHSLNLPKFYDIDRKDTNTEYVNIKVYKVPDKDGKTQRPLFKDIDWDNVKWEDANKGHRYGPLWKTFWFHVELEFPSEWLKKPEEIDFEWDSNSEAFLYDETGFPLQAFTGGGQRTLYKFPETYWKKGKQVFYVEMACNGMFGISSDGFPDPNRYFTLSKCEVVLPNVTARKLYWDFWIIGDAARELGGSSISQKFQASAVANEIIDAFDPEDVKTVDKGRKIAEKILGSQVDSEDVFYTNPLKKIDVYAVGNCHIDTAWLWPFAETKRKIVRSWTTQLKIADTYPEYVFVASQMQQFKWLKLYHPEIFAEVKNKFTTNQFLPVGGSWVENDTNMPNGESLIRQFVFGQRFQKNEFGIKATTFWLPDTFGYSSQIPQICQQVGIERFLTQKLSWNNINQFPLSTFNWVSLDGSQVLVHMPPANTYTASAHFGDVVRSQQQHKNLRDVPTGLLLYGHGDGGGGPTEEMVEKLRRARGLANTVGGIPTVQLGVTVDDFYEDVLARSNQGADLPSWLGEIYLEFHRGTYTTQADIKKYMRFGEVRLHDLEWLATTASVLTKYKYPAKELQALWEDLLLCQFHDVLPGSCIGEVYYDEAKPMLRNVLKKADELILEALKAIKRKALASTLPWPRQEVVAPKTKGMQAMLVDSREGDVTNKIVYPASVKVADGGFVLSNTLIEAHVASNGVLTSIYDLVNKREIIDTRKTKQTAGDVVGGGQYVLFDDEPLTYPAWDTELYSLNKFRFLNSGKVSVYKSNAVESLVLVKHQISQHSSIETEISIQGLSAAEIVQNNFIKFKVNVDWHETYKFLKVQFPTTIHTAPVALYETQFGITTRPTHYNTSWDVAKFEVCHHKFLDLSEFNYGVSVINDSKYGALVHGNLIRLSLLRSAKAPDDKADMGQHEFEFAVYPHKGSLGPDTVKLAHNFNYKLLVEEGQEDAPAVVTLHGDESLVLSHLKRGEDDADVNLYDRLALKEGKSIVVRVYESLGGLSRGTLKFHPDLAIKKVEKTNALEEPLSEIKVQNEGVEINLRGFEVATYRVQL